MLRMIAGRGGMDKKGGAPTRGAPNPTEPKRVRLTWAYQAPQPSSCDGPSCDRPSCDQPSYDRPSCGHPSYARPSYDQPSCDRPSCDQPSCGRPSYGLPSSWSSVLPSVLTTFLCRRRSSLRICARASESRYGLRNPLPQEVESRCPHHSHHREWPIWDRASCDCERRFQSASQNRSSGKKASTKNLRWHDSFPDSNRELRPHTSTRPSHCCLRMMHAAPNAGRCKSRSMPPNHDDTDDVPVERCASRVDTCDAGDVQPIDDGFRTRS